MATDIRLKESLPDITEALVATYTECSRINHLGHKPLPSREAIVDILADLLDILYPGYGRRQNLHIGNVEFHVGDVIDGLHDKLTQQIARAMRHENCQESDEADFEALAQQKAIELLKRLPDVRARLELDAQAAFEGDPAAKSFPEIIFCYPGVEAVTIYRIAHELLLGSTSHPTHDDGTCSFQNRNRHSARRSHWRQLLPRSRHRRCHWRDVRHRRSRKALSRRHLGSSKLSSGRVRKHHSRHETPSNTGG